MKEEYILDTFNFPTTAHCTFEFMTICDRPASLHIKKKKVKIISIFQKIYWKFQQMSCSQKVVQYIKAVDIRGNGSINGREIDTPKVFRTGKKFDSIWALMK